MHFRIGTRGSKLALAQPELAKEYILKRVPNSTAEIVPIKTSGDILKDKNLKDIGGKGLFLKEIEASLLNGQIDIAVHSLKDVPGFIPKELTIPCVLPREIPQDAIITRSGLTFEKLPAGSRIGTCSPRRISQILNLRPDLNPIQLRGNIHSRILKVEKGELDAIILAASGLIRANLQNKVNYSLLPMEHFIPAVGQGTIAIECKKDDKYLIDILRSCNDVQTSTATKAERSFLKGINGNCNTPLAAYANILEDHFVSITASYYSEDGKHAFYFKGKSSIGGAEVLGKQAANSIKAQVKEAVRANNLSNPDLLHLINGTLSDPKA